MTLCTAWIRKTGDNDELIFATDSCLSAGERWPTGIKLFDLPRKDALICFAGRTDRAYPLILNLISALQYNKEFQDKAKDVSDLALFVSDLFTHLVYLITEHSESADELRAEATFLFGGWSWKNKQFVLFKIFYQPSEKTFIYEDCLAGKKTHYFTFIGDYVEDAENLCYDEFSGRNSLNVLDMEPLKVLVTICRGDNTKYDYVRGPIQIAKVYPSSNSEMFGVMWPSRNGKPHFMGKEYKLFEKPEVRYFDPDTLVIHEMVLPEYLDVISETLFGDYVSLVEKCYPNGKLINNLSKGERKLLLEVLKTSFYHDVLKDLQNSASNEQSAIQQTVEEEEKNIGYSETSQKLLPLETLESEVNTSNPTYPEALEIKKVEVDKITVFEISKKAINSSSKFKRRKWRR